MTLVCFVFVQRLPEGASDVNGRLVIAQATPAMSGEYTCQVIGVDGDFRAVARLEVIECKLLCIGGPI